MELGGAGLEDGLAPLSERMLELAGIAPGQRVLDVGTGIGEPAVRAAQRVGPAGTVVAIDLSPGMLAIARERADAAGLANVELIAADADSLDLAAGSFDAVLSRLGLMFMTDVPAGLVRLRELLKPGGRLAAAVWGSPAQGPMVSLPTAVVLRELGKTPPPPGPFNLSDADRLAEMTREAGFADVRTEPIPFHLDLASPAEFLRFQKDIATPIKLLMADQTPERQDEVWNAMLPELQRFVTPDGRFRMENAMTLLSARR